MQRARTDALRASFDYTVDQVRPAGQLARGIRILAGCLAAAIAVVGFFTFKNERAFKRQHDEERISLDQALKAESRPTSLLINGAL